MRKSINCKENENKMKRSKIIRWTILVSVIIGSIIIALSIVMSFCGAFNSVITDENDIRINKNGQKYVQQNAKQQKKLEMSTFQIYGDNLYFINPIRNGLFKYNLNDSTTSQISSQRINKFLVYEGKIFFLKINGSNFEICNLDEKSDEIFETGAKIDDLDNPCTLIGNEIYYSSHQDGFLKINLDDYVIRNLLSDYVYDFEKYGEMIFAEVSDGFGVSLFAMHNDGSDVSRLMNKDPDSLCVYDNKIFFLGREAIYYYNLKEDQIEKVDNVSTKDGLNLFNDKLLFRDISRNKYNLLEIMTDKTDTILSDLNTNSAIKFLGSMDTQLFFIDITTIKESKNIRIVKFDMETKKVTNEISFVNAEKLNIALFDEQVVMKNDVGLNLFDDNFKLIHSIQF